MNSVECYGTWSWYHRFGVSLGGAVRKVIDDLHLLGHELLQLGVHAIGGPQVGQDDGLPPQGRQMPSKLDGPQGTHLGLWRKIR